MSHWGLSGVLVRCIKHKCTQMLSSPILFPFAAKSQRAWTGIQADNFCWIMSAQASESYSSIRLKLGM